MSALAPIAALSQAARAYGAGSATASVAAPKAAASGDFGSLVGGAMQSAVATLHRSEQTTARGVVGKADVQEVVQAASDAEVTVQTTVGILGKVTAAYNDIMHMSA